MQNKRAARLAFISIICAICFNFPVLRLLGENKLILGVPQLYFYIFAIWLLVIIATYLTLRSKRS
ncbi:MAG: hypothetical protein AAFY48_04430 [Bacteroidota bacterium]